MSILDLKAGDTFAHFRVVREIGAGGMGKVLEAHHEFTNRRVALKLIRPDRLDEEMRERMIQEARALAELDHPNIVRLHDANQTDGVIWLAMEFLEGRTLRTLRKLGGPMPVQHALQVLIEVCDGVAAAHEIHIVHRDLKPENVIITKNGTAKVLDFGAAKVMRKGEAMSTVVGSSGQRRVIGTPEYMSPEHLRGVRVDDRTDAYALGCIAYELLARHPFSEPDGTMPEMFETVRRQFTEEPPPLISLAPHVPDYVAEPIHRALAKPAAARPSVMEMAAAFRAAKIRHKAEAGDPTSVPFEKQWSGPGGWAASGPAMSIPQQVTPPSDPSRRVVVQEPTPPARGRGGTLSLGPNAAAAARAAPVSTVPNAQRAPQPAPPMSAAPLSPPAIVGDAPRSHSEPVYSKTEELPVAALSLGAARAALRSTPDAPQAMTVMPATQGPAERASHPARVRTRRAVVMVVLAASCAALLAGMLLFFKRAASEEPTPAAPQNVVPSAEPSAIATVEPSPSASASASASTSASATSNDVPPAVSGVVSTPAGQTKPSTSTPAVKPANTPKPAASSKPATTATALPKVDLPFGDLPPKGK